MRVVRIALSLVLTFPNLLPAVPGFHRPPQIPAAAPSATTTLQQSLVALVGNVSFADVTLSGQVRRIAGSDDETGTVSIKVASNGSARIDFSFPSGPRSEIRSTFGDTPVGVWSGTDGVIHELSSHNVVNDWGFFPAFSLAGLSSAQNRNVVLTYQGEESRLGRLVQHLRAVVKCPNAPAEFGALMEHLSQLDIYLDPNTYLPVAYGFNVHPDGDASVDIPVELVFSNYQVVNGVQVARHIQKFLNNGLVLDLELTNVLTNSGLSASSFNIQ
jgi:hypothetical protein